jgi:transposase InsO family protein
VWILDLRLKRKLGARRIQNELVRLHECSFSLATIHKVLKKHRVKPLKRRRRIPNPIRYSRPIPGDRVQMDVCKIAPGRYQYTAVDDCTRYRVLGLHRRRSAKQTLEFLEQVIEEMPFPIQRIQTDRGREFFAVKVQERLMEYGIKFRPIRPASPHLNGKVERSQKTDLHEFYATVDLDDPELEGRLAEWQHYYNWQRVHGSLEGHTPMERFFELIHSTPYWDDVHENYDPGKERIQEADYALDLRLRRLKRSL